MVDNVEVFVNEAAQAGDATALSELVDETENVANKR